MPDPITLIVGALAASAAATGKEVVSQAVKDAYNGLKALIISKYESTPKVAATLQTLELSPESKDIQGVVEKAFREAGMDQDEEVKTKIQELRSQLEKENLLPQTVYQGKVEGSGALAQGEGAVAAGASGIAVGGNVQGNLTTGGKKPDQS
jgi:gas vesicle protein